MMKKILIVGNFTDTTNLENSYKRAFEEDGYQFCFFDPYLEERMCIKLGKFGQIIHRYFPVEAWRREMNINFVKMAQNYKPDIIIIVCNAPIISNSIAYLKAKIDTKITLLWPDPILYISSNVQSCAKLYDFVLTFSQKSVLVFNSLGFKNVKWLPLAGDMYLHKIATLPQKFDNDLCFVGAYRKERSEILEAIKLNFPYLKLEIYGTNWERYKGTLEPNIIAKPLRGKELAEKFNKSLINLNIFDVTGLDAPNMRFFEIPMAKGFQLCSICPEMEQSFKEGEHLFYYNNAEDANKKIQYCLDNSEKLNGMRIKANELVLSEHLYKHRVLDFIFL